MTSRKEFEINQINDSDELDRAAEKLNVAILNAYEASCPLTHFKVKQNMPWWEWNWN
jgi:hypothetical protein